MAATALQAGGTLAQGRAQRKAGEYESAQHRQNADAAYAAGTREAHEERRKGRVAASDARAAMAGMGRTTDDPGAIHLLSRLGERTEYNALSALYEGERKQQGHQQAAHASKFESRMATREANIKALGTVISGGIRARNS